MKTRNPFGKSHMTWQLVVSEVNYGCEYVMETFSNKWRAWLIVLFHAKINDKWNCNQSSEQGGEMEQRNGTEISHRSITLTTIWPNTCNW